MLATKWLTGKLQYTRQLYVQLVIDVNAEYEHHACYDNAPPQLDPCPAVQP